MKSIEEYAIDLVASGAESHAEDDMNEDGEIADDDHRAAVDLAIEIAQAIRANPEPVLTLISRQVPPATPEEELDAELAYESVQISDRRMREEHE